MKDSSLYFIDDYYIQTGVNPHTLICTKPDFNFLMKTKILLHTLISFKILKPVKVTRKGYVIDGNYRLYIAKLLKLTVDVVIVC